MDFYYVSMWHAEMLSDSHGREMVPFLEYMLLMENLQKITLCQ